MRKNSSKLILAVIGAILICCLCGFFGTSLKAQLNLDGEYGKGYQLVYKVDSSEELTTKKAAEVLEKRLFGFGASSVTSSVEGNVITLQATGLSADKIEQIRTDLTATGEVTLRNSANELLMNGADVLAENALLSVMKDTNDAVYYVLNVADGDAFYKATATLALQTNKLMVVWMDYQEGQDYTAEAAKSAPGYLAAAAVSSGMRESCYMVSAKNYDDSIRYAVIVNGGILPAKVTETSFAAVEPKSSLSSALLTIVCPLALALGYMIARYGAAGIVSTLMMAGYGVAFFKMTQLSNVLFNSDLVAVFAISVALGLLLTVIVYEKSRKELLRGRNLSASYTAAYQSQSISNWESAIIMIVTGGIGVLLLKDTARSMAIAAALGGVCNLVFMVIWNKLMLMDLIESGYISKNSFGVKESELPDVEKGESYQEKVTASPLRMLVANKACNYLFYALAVGGCIMAFTSGNSWMIILTAAIAVILAGCYGYFRYRKISAIAIAAAGCTAAFGSLLVTGLLSHADGQSLACCSVALGCAILMLNELKTAFRPISREKLNQEKMDRVIDTALNNLTIACCIALVGSLSGIKPAGIILAVLAIASAIAVSGSLWVNMTRTNSDRKPAKRKNNRKELKERTIFGLNEVK